MTVLGTAGIVVDDLVRHRNTMDERFAILKLILNIIAVIAAGAALWYSHSANVASNRALYVAELAPFKPMLVASDPLWKIDEVQIGKSAKLSLVLISTITFSNSGAQQGCIADLAAMLQVPLTGDKLTLRPYQFVNEVKLFEVLRTRRPIYEAWESSFSPIALLGKYQITKTVLFRTPDFDRKDLREGTYVLDIIGTDCNASSQWLPFLKATFVVDSERAADLLRGQATVFGSEERIRSRSTAKAP